MSKIIRLKPGVWPSNPLTPDAVQEHMQAGSTRADEVERTGRAYRRTGFVIGIAGAALAVMGVGLAAYVVLREAPPPPYAIINQTTGEVTRLAASDAPRYFTQDTVREYLRKFVESCGGYNDTIRVDAYNRCVALMAPNQQARYREAFTGGNPQSPQNTIGKVAILVPEGMRYTKQPSGGNIQSWLVRYNQVEYRNGQKTRSIPWTVMVHFEWRPELAMTEEVRTWNTAGMRVVDYSFGADTGP